MYEIVDIENDAGDEVPTQEELVTCLGFLLEKVWETILTLILQGEYTQISLEEGFESFIREDF